MRFDLYLKRNASLSAHANRFQCFFPLLLSFAFLRFVFDDFDRHRFHLQSWNNRNTIRRWIFIYVFIGCQSARFRAYHTHSNINRLPLILCCCWSEESSPAPTTIRSFFSPSGHSHLFHCVCVRHRPSAI